MAGEESRDAAALAKAQRVAGDQDAALETLRGALGPLEAELEHGDESAAARLADILGQIGGALREKDELLESAAAYDAGYSYEQAYSLASTYNAVNRVVSRVLLCPEALADPQALRRHPDLPWIDVRAEAARLRDVLAASRERDVWAVADFALLSALTDSDPGDALDVLANQAAPSVRDACRPIAERLARLDTPRRAELQRVVRALS